MLNGDSRLVEASRLFKEKVVGEDKKKLGNVVNIIFDRKYFITRMLIFPDEETKTFLKKLLDSGKEISGDVIKGLSLPFDEKTDEILKKMMEKGRKEAFKIAREYLVEMEDRLKKIYYLVSIAEIDIVEKDKIVLKSAAESYEKECCNMDTSEDDVVLYGVNSIPDVKSLWPITLNVVKIRGEMANDQKNEPGRIMNLQLDQDTALVSNLIIQTVGRNAGKRLVDPKQFDFSTMSTKCKFQECPPL